MNMERLKIYLTNLGKYNEGVLIGEWVKLPVDDGALEEVMKRIGIRSGYEEYFITDFESSIANLNIGEFTPVGLVNELARQLDTLDDWAYEKLCAVVEAECPDTAHGVLALIEELAGFDLIPEVDDEESLGEYYAEACGIFTSLPETVQRYFDYEAYGRDIHAEGRGIFTSFGYVEDNR